MFGFDEDLFDFLALKKITFNQFAMCWLLYTHNSKEILRYNNEVIKLSSTYIKEGPEFRQELGDLIERGIVTRIVVDPKEPHNIDNYTIDDKFFEAHLAHDKAARELWDNYPKTINVNGNLVRTKNWSYEVFVTTYLKAINYNLKRHKEVMRKLEIWKQAHDHAETKLEKWVTSFAWEDIDEETVRKIRIH